MIKTFFAGIPSDFSLWLDPDLTLLDEEDFERLSTTMVGVVDSDFDSHLRSYLRQALAGNRVHTFDEHAKLADMASELRFSAGPPDMAVDIKLGIQIDEWVTLDKNLRKRPDVKAAAARRAGKITINEKREEAFNRILLELLAITRRIEILDPYAATSIMDPGRTGNSLSGRAWLLRRLMEESPNASISIWSRIQESQGNSVETQNQKIQNLVDTLKEKVEQLAGFRGPLTVNLRGKHPIFHERFIRLVFDKGSLSFRLDKGLDTFSQPAFEVEVFLDLRTPADFTTYRGQIESQTRQICPPLRIR